MKDFLGGSKFDNSSRVDDRDTVSEFSHDEHIV
jgi:hypothetical protein